MIKHKKNVLLLLLALAGISFAVIQTRQQRLQQQLDLFGEFYTLLDKNYVDTLSLEDLMKRSMRKTLNELDPYSNYFDSAETQKRDNDWKGILYAGIGSTVKQTDSGVVIVEPATGLPAMNAGLRTGDLILNIDGTDVKHMGLDSVIHRLKGHEGDTIRLALKRPQGGIFSKAFARQNIISKAVPLYYIMGDGTGYILFSHFLSGSAEALRKAVVDLKTQGMKKLVLDMRNNNGGLVEECAAALGIFFKTNTLVCSLRLKDSTANYSYYTTGQPVDTTLRVILLTNRQTISSGEIFAGCMKDHHRALLAGDRTYGKGFVQGTRYFKGGQTLYVTVARYYTPSGSFIGAKGVEPDLHCITEDSIPPHLQALFNSGLITDYSIVYRNTHPDNNQFDGVIPYAAFSQYYLARLNAVKFTEETSIDALSAYPAAKNLKAEIGQAKKQLLDIYRTQIEVELKREILKRYYQYNQAGQVAFEASAVYRFIKTLR